MQSGDDVLKSLTEEADNDALTAAILETLLHDISALFGRMLSDQLPQGKNFEKNATTNPECKSTLKHNKLPETVFARLDFLEHTKPAATSLTKESAVLYNFNRVTEWLDSMSPEERKVHFEGASVLRKLTVVKFKAHHQKMQDDKLALLLKRREEIARKKARELEERTKLTDNIVVHGLWQTEGQVSAMLETYPTKGEKTAAVKQQIKFRKNVLRQEVPDASVYAFSSKGKVSSYNQLLSNLLKLVELASAVRVEVDASPLVHQKVDHTFTVDGEDQVFRGTVISQVPGFPQWFNLVYVSEPDTVYTYKLNEDVEQGWLKVVEAATHTEASTTASDDE